jgi:hypothetical protein
MSDFKTEFEREALAKPVGVVREVLGFLIQNKKWWLLPVVLVMFVLGGLVMLSGTGAAPLLYSIF